MVSRRRYFMSLVVSQASGVKVYNVTAGKTLPEWVKESKKQKVSLRKNEEYRRRIELIQGFDYPVSCQRAKLSRDGNYIVTSGVYKPRIRVFDTQELSLKFERHVDCEIVDLHILTEDYSKIALLHADRTVSFHARYGYHYSTRVPRAGRCIGYHAPSCDLLVGGSASEVFRLNLDQGRFLEPFKLDTESVNALSFNEHFNLFFFGCDNGTVQAIDPRIRKRVGMLDVRALLPDDHQRQERLAVVGAVGRKRSEVTAVACDESDGLRLGCGTAGGIAMVFDIRSTKPLAMKDHQYDMPIHSVRFHPRQRRILTADTKVIKCWEETSARSNEVNEESQFQRSAPQNVFSIETPSDMNDLCMVQDTGLLVVPQEQPKIGAYYIPELGPAPKWCMFLDHITEELEEEAHGSIYDDYRFVTRQELSDLGMIHLVGTPLLRAHMHGFFMDARLHDKARQMAEPFAYDEYRKKKIQERIARETEGRITVQDRFSIELRLVPRHWFLGDSATAGSIAPKASMVSYLRKVPKVNKRFAERLQEEAEDDEVQNDLLASSKQKKKAAEKSRVAKSILEDDRFSSMFTRKEFEVDENSEAFQRLHAIQNKMRGADAGSQYRHQAATPASTSEDSGSDSSGDDDDIAAEVARSVRQSAHKSSGSTANRPAKMRAVSTSKAAMFGSSEKKMRKRMREAEKPLAERLKRREVVQHDRRAAGEKDIIVQRVSEKRK